MQTLIRPTLSSDIHSLLNISNIGFVINKYKSNNSILNQSLEIVIAVDAISFHPRIKINKNGLVIGVKDKKIVEDLNIQQMERSFKEFEDYINSIKNPTITDAFIYQINPIKREFPCHVVHIELSTQGKATNNEIEVLFKIRKILQDENITVEAIAFDGDTTYFKLHSEFFNYYRKYINDYYFRNFFKITSTGIISDPLHILKKIRHRALKNKMSTNFQQINILSIDTLKEYLNLPDIVFSNDKITKMHDVLPLRLLSLWVAIL